MATKKNERDRDVARKRSTSSTEKNVDVPPCENPKRRKRLEKDDIKWLRWYFDDPQDPIESRFWYEFTFQQREMIEAIGNRLIYGGYQSLAASRGEGKTKYLERQLLKYTLQGIVPFALLLCATGSKAEDSLASIKSAIEKNSRLSADYPEVCVPVCALEYTPNRANYQTVSGRRHDNGKPYDHFPSRFSWCGQQIIFPNVPGSPSAGSIYATRGLDAEVRGLNKFDRRVAVVGIDDPDTEETVNSEDQAKKLEKRIERGIAFLGGQKKSVAVIMLTTLQDNKCISAKFTDPKLKPAWQGKRFRFLLEKSSRMDLWDEYIQLWQLNLQEGDTFARKAHAFYLANRKAMDDGAAVANPNRYDGATLPDGTNLEVSAIQHYFNKVAQLGQETVSTEYDNDPPAESGPIESGITANRIQRQVSGYPRKIVPPGCTIVTQGIDCRKVALHRVVRAWRPDGTGFTIDYGVQEVIGTVRGSDEGLDTALIRSLHAVKDFMREGPYRTVEGVEVPIALTLVDAGWRSDAIYHACKELGLGWMPAMGFGKSSGCVQANFNPVLHATYDRKPGDGWFMSRRPNGVWLVCMDTDRWKAWEHDRWMTPTDKPGTMMLFGESDGGDRLSFDEKGHFSYAKHLTAEVEVEEPIKGALRRKWKAKSDTNHYFDASYMADVAANMKGIKLLKVGSGPTAAAQAASSGGWFAAQTASGRKRRAS